MSRYATQLRFCNLDKIAKYLGITNFEGSNSCSFALALFHLSHPLLAVLRGFLYLIKLSTIASTNNASFRSAHWWLMYKRRLNQLYDVIVISESLYQATY